MSAVFARQFFMSEASADSLPLRFQVGDGDNVTLVHLGRQSKLAGVPRCRTSALKTRPFKLQPFEFSLGNFKATGKLVIGPRICRWPARLNKKRREPVARA